LPGVIGEFGGHLSRVSPCRGYPKMQVERILMLRHSNSNLHGCWLGPTEGSVRAGSQLPSVIGNS
jgi:hypothetical protein